MSYLFVIALNLTLHPSVLAVVHTVFAFLFSCKGTTVCMF